MIPERGTQWQFNGPGDVEVWTVYETDHRRIFGVELEEGVTPGVAMRREVDGVHELVVWPATMFDDTGMVTRIA